MLKDRKIDSHGETRYERRDVAQQTAIALAKHHSKKSRVAILLNYQDLPEEQYQKEQQAQGPIAKPGDIHPNEPNWEEYRDPLDAPYWNTVQQEQRDNDHSPESIVANGRGHERIAGNTRGTKAKAKGKNFKRIVRISLANERAVTPPVELDWATKALFREWVREIVNSGIGNLAPQTQNNGRYRRVRS